MIRERLETHRNNAEESPNPSARLKIASLDAAPKSRRANIARYRSNSGFEVSRRAIRSAGMSSREDDGAGSMVGNSGLRRKLAWHCCLRTRCRT